MKGPLHSRFTQAANLAVDGILERLQSNNLHEPWSVGSFDVHTKDLLFRCSGTKSNFKSAMMDVHKDGQHAETANCFDRDGAPESCQNLWSSTGCCRTSDMQASSVIKLPLMYVLVTENVQEISGRVVQRQRAIGRGHETPGYRRHGKWKDARQRRQSHFRSVQRLTCEK